MPSLTRCTIAFDLDGTLVDTVGDLNLALNGVLAKENLPLARLEDVRAFLGGGARTLIIRACAVHGIHPNASAIERMTEAYIAANSQDIAVHSTPYPGLVDALETLRRLGAVLCVCTNKRTDLANQLLAALGLSHHFAAVTGADEVKNRKPHPDHFIAAIRAAQGDPAHMLMVGDSASDVGAAKAAGAPVAVYAWGYSDTAPELLGADAVFNHYADLPDLAVRLLSPQPTPRV